MRSIQLSYGRRGGESSDRPAISGSAPGAAAAVGGAASTLGAMDLSVAFLGTGGPVPTALRGTASLLVTRGGDRLMFDCGEGTQRQLRLSTGLIQVNRALPDPLPPRPLPGPSRTAQDLRPQRPHRAAFALRAGRAEPHAEGLLAADRTARLRPHVVELEPGDLVAASRLRSRGIQGRAPHQGPRLRDPRRRPPGHCSTPKRRSASESKPGPDFKALQDGRVGRRQPRDRRARAGDGRGAPGRAIAITGDTAPCQATVAAAADADLLVHDSSFMNGGRRSGCRNRAFDRSPTRRGSRPRRT